MSQHAGENRCVTLTETGLSRLHAARQRYRATLDDIVGDANTPSVNTVKRVLRQKPVFVSTLDRIWDYFQRSASKHGERLPLMVEGRDYVFVEERPENEDKSECRENRPGGGNGQNGWISRHVPPSNRLFTGRRETLERLRAALAAGPAALIGDPQALTGLGGIGKTQTALAYVYAHRRDYRRVFWVSAETIDLLNDGLVHLAEELKLVDPAPSRKSQALQAIHDWFRNEPGWLLVLDNADDLATLAPHFPRHHTGHVIVTTRTRNTVRWAAPVALDTMDRDEGALLLLRRAGILGVHQTLTDAAGDIANTARELSEELGGLPLALDQAGAYLSETTTTIADYQVRYRSYGLRLLDSITDPEHAAVTITFTLALEQLSGRTRYGQAAVEMVCLCAFLAPDAIPEAVFAGYRFGRPDAPLPEGTGTYDAVCAAVCGYSMATRNPGNQTLTVHRLVQKVARDTLNAEELRAWSERAVCAVADATPDFEYEDWSLCDLLLPQWRLCADYIRENGIETPPAAYLLYQMGRYLRARALYEEAEAALKRARSIAEKAHGPDHRIMADLLDELACLYRALDRRADAEALHVRAVEIVESLAGPDHPDVAAKLHNLALLYLQCEEYSRAEAYFLRAIAIHERQPSPDRILIATATTQMAGVYRLQGDFDRAEVYCRRALDTYESLLPPDHIDIATACNNLALLYLTMGRYEEADILYERALRINEQARGREHPETAHVAWGLAKVRWKQNRRAEAEALFCRALDALSNYFGPEHSRTARVRNSYLEFQQDRARQAA